MSKVNELIEALSDIYFGEENTSERYKILSEIENAVKEMRSITVQQIDSLDRLRNH